MKNTDALDRTTIQIETTLANFLSERPLTSVLTAFGVGVALGVSEDTFHSRNLIRNVGRKLLENHGTALLDQAVQGALGSILLKTSVAVLNDYLDQTSSKTEASFGTGSQKN
jgi:hypothetical protein